MVIFAFTGMALFNISLNKERHFALPSALKCARKALRIWQTSLPPEHEDIADATVLVRRLEQAMGIDDALVRRALACSGGDEERAFDLLLSSHVPSLGQSCSASANVGQPVSAMHPVPAVIQTPIAPAAHALQLGSRVRIEGLLAAPEMNGRRGVICEAFNAQSGRWTVDIDADGPKPACRGVFRPGNLEAGDEAEDMEWTRTFASMLLDQGRLNEALSMFERVLEFRRRVLPESHPDIGEGHVELCAACFVDFEGCVFECEVQARSWTILLWHTVNLEGMRMRLRRCKAFWSAGFACCPRTIL
jgi:hypothetical protein